MKKKMLVGLLFAAMAIGFLAAVPARAQSAYFQAVTNLNPTTYWPMHERTPPIQGSVETNYGTLGPVGDAYFGDWAGNNAVGRQMPGALANDPDTSLAFSGGRPSYLLVPHTSPAATLSPPFTMECWAYPTNTQYGDVMAQAGATLNGAGNDGNKVGIRLMWQGNNSIAPAFQVYVGSGTGQSSFDSNPSLYPCAPNNWYYVVLTCDANTNFTLYLNGTPVTAINLPMAPTSWNPLTIGGGWWDTRHFPYRLFKGSVDEVAVYTNVLSDTDISAHYSAGTSGAAGDYFASVSASQPLLYYRMDAPPYTEADASTWPVMANYGSAAVDGVYRPGLAPGSVGGPDNRFGGFAAGFGADTNAAPCNGLSTFARVYNPSVFNVPYNEADPANDTPFTISAWFQGNPHDSRVQSVLSHGASSWYLRQTTYGYMRFSSGGGESIEINGGQVNRDRAWHQVVAIHEGNTNSIYIDGLLKTIDSGEQYTNGPGNDLDFMIGAAPDYTNNPVGPGRQFAGNVCEVAFWNGTALSPSQVQGLYDAAGVGPQITAEPVTGRTVSGGDGTYIYFGVVASASAPVYQWYFNTASNYAGATRLVDGAKYLDATTSQVTVTNLDEPDSGYYYVVITNDYGSVTSRLASLTVILAPTVVSQVPVTYTNLYTLYAGASPTFAITSVRGAQPMTYQWYSNGVMVADATNSTFTMSDVAVGGLTTYCVLTNDAGMSTSLVWTAQVVLPPTEPYPQSVLGLNPLGYWRLNEPDNMVYDGNPGAVAHDYMGGNDGYYTNALLGQAGYNWITDPTTTSALFGYYSTTDSGALGIQGVDFSSPTNTSRAFSVAAWVSGYAASQTNGAGLVTKGSGGDEQFNLDVYGSNRGFRFFVRDADDKTHGVTDNGQTGTLDGYWHHVVGVCDEPNGVVSLYIDGVLAGQSAIAPGSGILATSHPMSIGTRRSSSTSAYNNGFYGNMNDVAVYGYALSAEQVRASYLIAGVAPHITLQPPASVTVNEGGTLTIPADALGTEPVSYQWYDYLTGTLADQTNATLVLSNVPAGLNGDTLYLIANNAYGSVGSAYATLTVISGAPQITVSNLPAQVVLAQGKTYTYSVEAVGTEPFNYQWLVGGSPVSGETNSSYTVTATALGSSTISVTIGNIYGSAGGSSLLAVVAPPTDAYASNVLALQPAGYWPLQETYAPAPVTTETNLGALGALGNAYYVIANESQVAMGQAGALVGDADTAVGFSGSGGMGYAVVPSVSPLITPVPPFTIECWANPSSSGYGDIVGNRGSALNTTNKSVATGVSLYWEHNPSQFAIFVGNGSGQTGLRQSNTNIDLGVWHHVALTCDANTNFVLYVDGSADASTNVTYVPGTWNPLTIGAGYWNWKQAASTPYRYFPGGLDEVAVYTNALTAAQIGNHYAVGTTSGQNYMQTITNDGPLLYYRMDVPAYITPDPALYPTAVNFGSAPVNGAYQAGIVPGQIAGPAILGLTQGVAAPINGVISGIDAGNDPAFNPTGAQPFSVSLWFKSNPADNRVQSLISHGANNWSFDLDGTTGQLVCSLGGIGSLVSTAMINDGNWHHAAGVFDGATGYLYVDGALDVSAPVTGDLTGEPEASLFLGGNSDYTTIGRNQRYFAGALAQVAYFTNALSEAQVQTLYSPVSRPMLSVNRVDGQVVITYTGTLLSSPTADGTYEPVAGASSPYTVPTGEAQRFYRSSNP